MKFFIRKHWFLLFCFSSAAILRILYLLTPEVDSDQAIIGLAGMHILRGEFPLFFYGGAFEGIIEGYIAAPLFWMFGISRYTLNSIPAVMSLVGIYCIYKLAQIMFGQKVAKLTLLFSCIAPPFFLIRTTVPLEGYIETISLGALTFILTYKIINLPSLDNLKNLVKLYFWLGLITGFAFYLQFHIVPFAITMAIFILLHDKKIIFRKHFLFFIIGFIIGNLPLIIYNITHNFETLSMVGTNNSRFLTTAKNLFFYGYWVILGIKIDNTDIYYIPYISILLKLIYIWFFIYFIFKRKPGSKIIITFLLIFSVTYWLSGKGEVNTRRYLLPLFAVLPVIIGYGLNAIKEKSRLLFYCIVTIILGSNLYTNFSSITIFNPEQLKSYKSKLLQEQKLFDFLKSKNIKGAYALSWWDSFRLNFDCKEEIIFNLFDKDPYQKYQKIVDAIPNPAFIDHYNEFLPTFESIGGSHDSYAIPNERGDTPTFNIYYNFIPASQTLEEIDNSKWTADSSHNRSFATFAFDRDIATRWHSDTAQKKGMSFTLDLGSVHSNVTRLCYHPGPETDCPNSYELYTSINGEQWNRVSQNTNFIIPSFWNGPHPFLRYKNGLIEIDFTPQNVRYLKLVITEDKNPWYWSINEVYVYLQKNTHPKDWNIENLLIYLSTINPDKIYADPWVSSHLPDKFDLNNADKPPRLDFIYSAYVVKQQKLKKYAFVVLEEHYNSFIQQLNGIPCITKDFGAYKLITFSEDVTNSNKFYWDGFHLLKCTL